MRGEEESENHQPAVIIALAARLPKVLMRTRLLFASGSAEGSLRSPDLQGYGFEADNADRCLSLTHVQHGARTADVG
jgi:hypothetical protein